MDNVYDSGSELCDQDISEGLNLARLQELLSLMVRIYRN